MNDLRLFLKVDKDTTMEKDDEQQQQFPLVLEVDEVTELMKGCFKASNIDQSSLSIALSNLAQCLRRVTSNSTTISSTTTTSTNVTTSTRNDTRPSVSVDEDMYNNNDILINTASSLLQLHQIVSNSIGTTNANVNVNANVNTISHTKSRTKTQQYILSQIDECLDLCGLRTSFLVAFDLIHGMSSSSTNHSIESSSTTASPSPSPSNFNSCIMSSCRLIKRILLQTQTQAQTQTLKGTTINHKNDDYLILQSFLKDYFHYPHTHHNHHHHHHQDQDQDQNTNHKNIQLENQVLQFINSIIIVLPTQIANAFHLCRLKLPIWATRSNFFVQMIESSAYAATAAINKSSKQGGIFQKEIKDYDNNHYHNNNNNNDIEMLFLVKLIETLLHHGSVDDVSNGIFKFRQQFISKSRRRNKVSSLLLLSSSSNDNNNSDNITNDCTTTTTATDQNNDYDNNNENIDLEVAKYVLQSMTMQLKSPRSCAMLIRSSIKKVISEIELLYNHPTTPITTMTTMTTKDEEEQTQKQTKNYNIYNNKTLMKICKDQCMPYLHDISLGMLSDERNRDMIVDLLILSPSTTGNTLEQKLTTMCVVELFECCCHNGDNDDDINDGEEDVDYNADHDSDGNDENGDDDTKRNTGRVNSKLMKHLIDVINVWNDIMFINETDHFQQRHISSFILYSINYMYKDYNAHNKRQQQQQHQQEVAIQGLVLGITNRLKVTEKSIRLDGMMIAEKIAPILGENLRFDELNGIRDEDVSLFDAEKVNIGEEGSNSNSNSNHDAKEREKSTRKKKKIKKISVEIDPDEEYMSDDMSSCGSNESAHTGSSESYCSSGSSWGEEDLVAYELSDDEEDLRPVLKPTYLHECLNLLRSTEDDNEARHMHEVALEEIASLVRDSPPDLIDMAALLTKELLHMEDKYNLTSFSQLRWGGLCALAVCAPLTSIPCLQRELFGDVALEVRLDVLDVMKYSSTELCGQFELDKRRNNRSLVPQKTELVDPKTRRWGRGRRLYENRSVSNNFGEVSPLFFYPLIQGFTESKSNEVLWGGENGGRLLSCLLMTLASFVENAGNHPGTSILASDLLNIAWSFYEAHNPEVRLAVLTSVAICLPHLTPDALARIICTEQLPKYLQTMKLTDPHEDCRQLATLILGSFTSISGPALK